MQQSKLRVWAKSSLGQPLNKLIYSDEFEYFPDFFIHIYEQEMEFDGYQLFTGIKDINNDDIYEGDILNCHFMNSPNIIVDKVYFKYGSFMCYDRPLFYFKQLEVIGNKYENPELLKDNK